MRREERGEERGERRDNEEESYVPAASLSRRADSRMGS